MQEHLHPTVDPIHDVGPREAVYHKSLFILSLKAVNMARPCCHRLAYGPNWAKLITLQPHKFSCAVPELLGYFDHVDLLVQDLPGFLPGKTVLAHGKKDLYLYHTLFPIRWDGRRLWSEEGK